MGARSWHIVWLGPKPADGGGAQGVAAELLEGLSALGYRIDCYFPSSGSAIPPRLLANPKLTFNWGTSNWKWGRWYSRTRLTAFLTGMAARSISLLRLRRQILESHREDPYDVIFQFSTIESFGVPAQLARTVPLVIRPDAHAAGELRSLLAERAIARRCQPLPRYAAIIATMLTRSIVQRVRVRRARLLVCISRVFRDRIVADYGYPVEDTAIVPNAVDVERFTPLQRPPAQPPTVLVLGRIAVRKGIDDVVAVARELRDRGSDVRFRVVGAPSLWSDYTPLLEDLPAENSEYVGSVDAGEIPGELERCDVLLQPSRYEPFGLTVAEALAAGVPVIGTDEVGALEGVDSSVAAEVRPGDVPAIAAAITEMLERLRAEPVQLRARARAEAERLFAPARVCEQLDAALEQLLAGGLGDATAGPGRAPAEPTRAQARAER